MAKHRSIFPPIFYRTLLTAIKEKAIHVSHQCWLASSSTVCGYHSEGFKMFSRSVKNWFVFAITTRNAKWQRSSDRTHKSHFLLHRLCKMTRRSDRTHKFHVPTAQTIQNNYKKFRQNSQIPRSYWTDYAKLLQEVPTELTNPTFLLNRLCKMTTRSSNGTHKANVPTEQTCGPTSVVLLSHLHNANLRSTLGHDLECWTHTHKVRGSSPIWFILYSYYCLQLQIRVIVVVVVVIVVVVIIIIIIIIFYFWEQLIYLSTHSI
jgi:hypothetical protein